MDKQSKLVKQSTSYISSVDIKNDFTVKELYQIARSDAVVRLCLNKLSGEAAKLGFSFTKDDKETEIIDKASDSSFQGALQVALKEYLITGNFFLRRQQIGKVSYFKAYARADVEDGFSQKSTSVSIDDEKYTFDTARGIYVKNDDPTITLAVHQSLVPTGQKEYKMDSPLISCFSMAQTHALILETNVNFLKKGSNMGGLLTYSGDTAYPSPTKAKEAVGAIKRLFQGVRNAGEVGIVPDQYKFTPTTITNKEGGYVILEKTTTERICSTFGVPIQFVSGQYSTYNNLEESSYQLQRSAQSLLSEVVLAIRRLFELNPDILITPAESDIELQGEKEIVRSTVLDNALKLQQLGQSEADIKAYLEENMK